MLVESEGIAYILASEGFKTVTPEGEIFELGGRAFAYGLRDALSKVLEALEDIENVGEVQGAVKALRGAIDKRKQQISALENEDRTLTKDRVKTIASVAALRAEAETVVRLSKRYRTMHRSINQDYEAQIRAVERLQRREASLQLKKDAITTEMRLLKEALAEQESLGLDGFIAEIEGARNDLSLQLSELSSKTSEIHLSYTREKANLEQMVAPNLERVRQDLEASEMQYEADRRFVQASRKELTELNHRFADLDAQLLKVLDSSTNSRPVLEEFDNKIRRLKEEAAASERSAFNTEKEIFTLQQRAISLQDKMAEQLSSLRFYGYDEVLELFEGSDQLLSQVEFEHEGLARTVNKSSERDYGVVYDGYRNLSQRINELEHERNSIVRFIESVDSEKRKVFASAFETINREFAGHVQDAHAGGSVARAGKQGRGIHRRDLHDGQLQGQASVGVLFDVWRGKVGDRRRAHTRDTEGQPAPVLPLRRDRPEPRPDELSEPRRASSRSGRSSRRSSWSPSRTRWSRRAVWPTGYTTWPVSQG